MIAPLVEGGAEVFAELGGEAALEEMAVSGLEREAGYLAAEEKNISDISRAAYSDQILQHAAQLETGVPEVNYAANRLAVQETDPIQYMDHADFNPGAVQQGNRVLQPVVELLAWDQVLKGYGERRRAHILQ